MNAVSKEEAAAWEKALCLGACVPTTRKDLTFLADVPKSFHPAHIVEV